jgi:ABC-type ATPase involved in cell division
VIRFDSVSKRYPEGREALIDLSFVVEPGAVEAAAPAGAGKGAPAKRRRRRKSGAARTAAPAAGG